MRHGNLRHKTRNKQQKCKNGIYEEQEFINEIKVLHVLFFSCLK